MTFNNILVLAPHTDDESLGCGATIAKMAEQGSNVYVYCFSDCGNVALIDEFAAAVYQLKVNDYDIDDLSVRYFYDKRQAILQTMIDLKFTPDVVFVPSTHELHQDHQIITQEAIRAFRNTTILGYELPWNNISSCNQCTVELTKDNVESKVLACMEYKSQSHRSYMNPEFIRSWAKMRGVQNGCDYAEVFEVIKLKI